MSDHAPPGTPANDDERTRLSNAPPGGRSRPADDPDATIIPPTPPSPNPPLYGSPAPRPPIAPPPAPSDYPPVTAPYPTAPPVYPGQGQPNPYGDPNAPPPYGSGYPPPAYGGTQPLPQPPVAPPFGGYPGGAPPYTGGYGYPPTGAYPPPGLPPKRSNRGLALGIVGGVLALIVIAGGVFAFARKSDTGAATATLARPTVVASVTAVASATVVASTPASTPTALSALPTTTAVAIATQAGGGTILGTLSAAATGTAGPGRNAGTPTAATSPTPAPTRAVPTATRAASRAAVSPTVGQGGLPPTPTGSARPGTAATTASVALGQTWTDPNGQLKFQYPNGWTVTQLANSQSNIVEVDGPDNISFYVDTFKQSGTPTEEAQATTDARAKSAQLIFTSGPTADAKVGGEPGKVMTYTAKRKDQTTGPAADGVLWIVNHGGSEYDFEALPVGKHRSEIDAIIASVVFTG